MSSDNFTQRQASTHIEALHGVQETLAQNDPLWATPSAPDKKGGKWNLTEFFHSGVVEIAGLIQTIRYHELIFDPEAALDFGCGVGRLSQALVSWFKKVDGVDVALTMIKKAEALNKVSR